MAQYFLSTNLFWQSAGVTVNRTPASHRLVGYPSDMTSMSLLNVCPYHEVIMLSYIAILCLTADDYVPVGVAFGRVFFVVLV